jgi:hypothetical protein
MYEVLPGQKMKLYGENFYFGAPWQPRVYFVKKGTDTRMEATVDLGKSDQFVLTITSPNDLESDAQYWILVDNDLGATSTTKLTVAAKVGKDYLGLGVGWGVNFGFVETNVVTLNASSDTSFDAFPSIQQTINQLSQQGGGMLVLSEGEFHWRTCSSLQIHGNIVIKGAGVNRTTIFSGYCNISGSWIYSSDASLSNFAIMDLSFKPGNFNGGFSGNAISGNNFNYMAMVRVYWDLKASRLSFGGTHALMQDVHVVLYSLPLNGWGSAFGFGCTKYGIYRNVWINFENGAITSSFLKYSVLENFHLIRDASKQFIPEGPIQSRMWSCNFCENIVVDKSQFETLNFNFSKDNNDGETILTEGGGPKRGEFAVGVVSSATATTLTDLTANWTLQTTDILSLTITDGPGFGQTRRLVSATTTTITIDEPWTVVPTSQSRYSLVTPGFMNWLIKDTLFKGNPRGIWLYAAAGTNATIVGNSFVNGAGIDYRPYQRSYPSTAIDRCGGLAQVQIPYYQQQITQVYKSRILNNDLYADDPNANAQIRFAGDQLSFQDTFTRGVMMFGLEVRGNKITRVGEQSLNLPSYMLAMCFEQQAGLPNATVHSIIGTIMQGNQVQGVPQALGFGSNLGSSVLACQSVTGQVAKNDTFNLDFNNCRFYASQTIDVHLLNDQCRSVNYLPPTPTAQQSPGTQQPSGVSSAHVIVRNISLVIVAILLVVM